MNKEEKYISEKLKSEVDINFEKDTINYIKKKELNRRILLGIAVFLISVISISFIPFGAMRIENIPLTDTKLVINKEYVFIAFTFAMILLLDTIFRNLILDKKKFAKTL